MHLNKMREPAWFYVKKIAALKALKIVWLDPNEWRTAFVASVNGTHRPINEPRDPLVRKNRKWYSHKDEHAGMNFEVVMALFESKTLINDISSPTFDRKQGIKCSKQTLIKKLS